MDASTTRVNTMSFSKKILKNVVSNWANLFVSLVISFFLAPFILHKIGNVYFGVWALVTQVTGYLWLLDFGVRESVIKYVAEYHEKKDHKVLNEVINGSLRMYGFVCFACILVAICLAIFFPIVFAISDDVLPVARLLVLITGLDIAQSFIFNVFLGILMGLQRYDLFSKISIGASIARAVLTVAFLSHGYGIVTLALIQFLLNGCTNLTVYWIARRSIMFRIELWQHEKHRNTQRMILTYGFFVFVNNISQQAVFYSSNLIIAIFLPVSSVTFFAIAASLIEYMKKIITTGTQVFNPLTSQLDAQNESGKIATLLVQGTKYSLLLGLPVAIVYIVTGKQFITLWMGAEYADTTGNILAVLAVSTLFSLPHYTISAILLGLNKHRIMAYCRFVEALANIGLSILLIQSMGVLGAALGAAIPHLILVLFVLPTIILKFVDLDLSTYLRLSYLGPFLSVLPFTIMCYLAEYFHTPHSLLAYFLQVAVFLLVYLVTIWFVSFTNEERKFCKNKLLRLVPTYYG